LVGESTDRYAEEFAVMKKMHVVRKIAKELGGVLVKSVMTSHGLFCCGHPGPTS
jgi:hypothetical protein